MQKNKRDLLLGWALILLGMSAMLCGVAKAGDEPTPVTGSGHRGKALQSLNAGTGAPRQSRIVYLPIPMPRIGLIWIPMVLQ